VRLAAVLVVVVVLGVAGAVAAQAVFRSEHAALAPAVLATTSTTPRPGAAPTTAGSGAPGSQSIDVAQAAACTAERQALDAAEQQYRILEGGYADASELVAAHYLREAPTLYRISSTDGWQTYRLQPVAACR